MSHDFYATLRRESSRYQDWLQVFGQESALSDGSVRVPIVSPVQHRVNLPIGVKTVVFLAIDQLTPEQHSRLVEFLSVRFNVPDSAVRDSIAGDPKHAVPLLDEDVMLTIYNPQKWFD